MDSRALGTAVVVLGLLVLLLGVLIRMGAFQWWGRLPGDFSYRGENVRFYFPLASMFLISLALSLVLYLLRRLM